MAGLDISRGSVTVAILEELPTIELRSFVKRCKVQKFKTAEIHELLALEFDAAILEPTGMHYARLWAELIEHSGREVRWVGHREVKGYRESWRLPDKTDKTDAIALACYGLERWHNRSYFIDPRIAEAAKLRELYLQLQFLNRSATPLINRLRQQLSWECPELSEKAAVRLWLGGSCGIWQAIAGQATPKWKQIIEHSQGLGIGRFSQALAAQIVSNELEQRRIESEIELILKGEHFQRYLEAMEPFHFGRRTATAILSAIYPIEKFAGHRNPLGAFKLSCGLAQVWHQSGDFTGWVPGGDVSIRNALWLWAKMAVPPHKRGHRFSSPELEVLRDYYQHGTEVEIEGELKHLDPGKGSQRLMRVARRALTMLYRKLK
jgi:transposase